MKEYIVTLKNKKDLQSFYDDMETEGGSLHIPNRKVVCSKRREISRNTRYLLTEEEAEELRQDERVIAVELPIEERGIIIRPSSTQFSDSWDRSWTVDPNDDNWGLKRCIDGKQTPGWGSNATASISDTITLTSTGKNVDVVIVDGHVNATHPELTVNADGTGGSRVNQINWFDYSSDAGTDDTGKTYNYGVGSIANNDHGQHVAGTVAGTTQGWAREANIYNICPYSEVPDLSNDELFDYVRAFHNNKPINPITGRRNPTITNNSWSYSYSIPITSITSVRFRGATYNGPFIAGILNSFGIDTFVDGVTYAVSPASVASVDADIEDAIEDGIIMVSAASNDNMKISVSGDQDYTNYINATGLYYYNQWGTPATSSTMICVGSVENQVEENKAYYSNCGPRVNIYAPGTAIQSSLRYSGTTDDRGALMGKYQGTSMASPQVCGVLACLMEQIPSLTQAQAIQYLEQYAGKDQLSDSGTDNNDQDQESLQGSPNRFLSYIRLRPLEGASYPRQAINPRPTTGAVFPRTKVRYK